MTLTVATVPSDIGKTRSVGEGEQREFTMKDAKTLVRQAFQQARVSGKPDWYRMTVAVMKNRLLNLTKREFDESQFGTNSIAEFLVLCEDILFLDTTVVPPMVELRESELRNNAEWNENLVHAAGRVRGDFWQAVIDYSSGTQYVWDANENQVVAGGTELDGPIVPSIDSTMLRDWRSEFFDEVREGSGVTVEQETRTKGWVQMFLPTSSLPSHMISSWNRFLRDKVHEWLLIWFNESGLDPPSDLFAISPPAPRRQRQRGAEEGQALRRFVLRVVGEMTERELQQLTLPARAVLRVTRTRYS